MQRHTHLSWGKSALHGSQFYSLSSLPSFSLHPFLVDHSLLFPLLLIFFFLFNTLFVCLTSALDVSKNMGGNNSKSHSDRVKTFQERHTAHQKPALQFLFSLLYLAKMNRPSVTNNMNQLSHLASVRCRPPVEDNNRYHTKHTDLCLLMC